PFRPTHVASPSISCRDSKMRSSRLSRTHWTKSPSTARSAEAGRPSTRQALAELNPVETQPLRGQRDGSPSLVRIDHVPVQPAILVKVASHLDARCVAQAARPHGAETSRGAEP